MGPIYGFVVIGESPGTRGGAGAQVKAAVFTHVARGTALRDAERGLGECQRNFQSSK
jgi:hypothetical protein